MEVMQKRSKAIHSSGTDSFHDRLFGSETSAGAFEKKTTLLSFHRWGRRRRRRWRLWGWGWMGWLAFFFYFSPSPNPGMILTLHLVFLLEKKISNFKNVSVNVLSSLYIFVAFVLFINLCNTSIIFQRSASYLRSPVTSAVFLFRSLGARTSHHPFTLAPSPQTDKCRLSQKALFLCKWLTGGRSFISDIIIVGQERKKK